MSIDKITRKANTSIPIEDENKKNHSAGGFLYRAETENVNGAALRSNKREITALA
jgi:hypothetical protein